ncbi:MAG TPA: lipid II flippase MurJ [Ktedonobacterales bacterium]|nr:lipid II flippase MurJ [Ktedonobacterales bacterium]
MSREDALVPRSEPSESFRGGPPLSLPGEPSAESAQFAEAAGVVEGMADGRERGRRRALASAGIIAVGQLLSSIMGFVRAEVLNIFFFGVASGAFVIALRPIQQVSDLIVQGSVSGALIPTFVDYSEEARREDLRRVYSTIANLVLIVMTVAVAAIFFAAPAFVPIFAGSSFGAGGQQLTVTLVRIIALSLYGLGLFAVTSGLLYALKEVVFPAFATAIYHVGIIVFGLAALGLAAHQLGLSLSTVTRAGSTSSAADTAHLLGAHGLAIGAAAGALGEFLILIPGLRKVRVHWRPVLDLRHPGVRQILKLYVPLVAGLVLSIAQQVVDVYLWGNSPGGAPENATALQTGTQLVQFPIGIIAAAFSFAVLPLLAAAATRNDTADFKHTLRMGFRLGLVLMVPAMVGLIALRLPILALLFQHGECGSGCTVRNALAVQNYAIQLPFVAVDQLLIAAFYARKNTIVPMIVGIVSIGFYLLVALPFGTTIGLPALAFANTTYIVSHAVILFVLLTLAIGNLGLGNLLGGVSRILVAAAVMAAICLAGLVYLPRWLPHVFAVQTSTLGELLTVLVAGGVGILAYFALVSLLGVEEVRMVGGIVRSRLGGRR